MTKTNPIELAQALIRCHSVTPADDGALGVLQGALEGLGFTCQRHVFTADDTPDVDNLYARIGDGVPNFCFAGHTDVVPVGDEAGWTVDPFGAHIRDGLLYGRGAADMKASLAAMVSGVEQFMADGPFDGAISFLITGDEEGPAINGTQKLVRTVLEAGEQISHCLIGEPTSVHELGDMAKIGRRGSLNIWLEVAGTQGHVAYPHLARNPAPDMLRLLAALEALHLDDGNEHFQPSNLEITWVDIPDVGENVVPPVARARFNIRFCSEHTADSLLTLVRETLDATGVSYTMTHRPNGEAFISPPGRLSELVVSACEKILGRTPELSTAGGTSDGRFMNQYFPLIEFGMANQTMHKVDERVRVDDITALAEVYAEILRGYFAGHEG